MVRREIMILIRSLSAHLKTGALSELTLTTNGTQLAKYADGLAAAGIRRVNVSLDSVNRCLGASAPPTAPTEEAT